MFVTISGNKNQRKKNSSLITYLWLGDEIVIKLIHPLTQIYK